MDLMGRRPSSLKCPLLHAPAAECPSRCQPTNYEIGSAICSGPMSSHLFSHSALLSVTSTHATALDAYLFWRHRSACRGTSLHRWVARAVKMFPPEMRTAQQQCKPVLCPWLWCIFLSCYRSAGFLCIYVLGGGGVSVFVQLLGFILILLFFFFYFCTYVLFLNRHYRNLWWGW